MSHDTPDRSDMEGDLVGRFVNSQEKMKKETARIIKLTDEQIIKEWKEAFPSKSK